MQARKAFWQINIVGAALAVYASSKHHQNALLLNKQKKPKAYCQHLATQAAASTMNVSEPFSARLYVVYLLTLQSCSACRLKQEVEVKQHSLSLLQQRIAGSQPAQLAQAVATTQQELEEAKQAALDAQQKKADMVKAAKVRHILYCI